MAKEEMNVDLKKNRYSDEELEEFRQIILEKLEKARKILKCLRMHTLMPMNMIP